MSANTGPERPPRLDRRVRRTRRALQDALLALAPEFGYEALTIDLITERADVARATFYLHFTDKHDLLTAIADDLVGDLVSQLEHLRPASHGVVVQAAFAHVAEHQPTYRLLLSGAGDGRALDRAFDLAAQFGTRMITRSAAARGVPTRVPVDAVARIWSGELVAAMRWWASNDTPYTAAELADLLLQVRYYGLAWVYRQQPGDPDLAREELPTRPELTPTPQSPPIGQGRPHRAAPRGESAPPPRPRLAGGR